MVDKRQDWPIKLNEVTARASTKPFAYGTHDCALFAADCVRAMTDVDLAKDFRGHYQSKPGAKRVLRQHEADDLEQLMDQIAARHGIQNASPMGAKRGDIVLRDTPEGPALGIVSGHYCCFAAPQGLTMVTVRECRRAWDL